MPTKLTKPIFLCGYTNSGKTTIGKELARQLDVPFYDTDELITSQTGQTPQQIFASQGNEAFRNIEHEITKQVSSYSPCVISTGGGLSCLGGDQFVCTVKWRSAHLLPQRRSSLQSRYHYLLKPPL